MAINTAGQTRTPASEIYMDGMAKYARVRWCSMRRRSPLRTTSRITLGFVPKYFVFSNDTDRVMVEWRDGMAQDSCIKTVAAGTRTLEVTGGNHGVIVGVKNSDTALTSANSGTIPGQGQVQVSQNATLAVIFASKTCRWTALG
jgi:hypothetical protein